jgi:hypothetical protein
MYETGGWSPTAMPRRETQHSFLHPRYDGRAQAQTQAGRARVVEERMTREETNLSVDIEDPAD